MGKSSRTKGRETTAAADGAVGPRQPCPCGSGRRYKACHGAADGPPTAYVPRPFDGYAGECDLIALRELVPAATAPITPQGQRPRRCCSARCCRWRRRPWCATTAAIWLGLQVQHGFGDPSRDLGAVLEKALAAEAGGVGPDRRRPVRVPRFQDLVVDAPLEVTVHDGFDFWIDEKDRDATTAAALEQANGAAHPTTRLTGVEAAYWTDVGPKEHLRWVMPEPEDALLDALARLHAAGQDELAEGSRLVGHVPRPRPAGPRVGPARRHRRRGPREAGRPVRRRPRRGARRTTDLTPEERSARSGLANRQVTIR